MFSCAPKWDYSAKVPPGIIETNKTIRVNLSWVFINILIVPEITGITGLCRVLKFLNNLHGYVIQDRKYEEIMQIWISCLQKI